MVLQIALGIVLAFSLILLLIAFGQILGFALATILAAGCIWLLLIAVGLWPFILQWALKGPLETLAVVGGLLVAPLAVYRVIKAVYRMIEALTPEARLRARQGRHERRLQQEAGRKQRLIAQIWIERAVRAGATHKDAARKYAEQAEWDEELENSVSDAELAQYEEAERKRDRAKSRWFLTWAILLFALLMFSWWKIGHISADEAFAVAIIFSFAYTALYIVWRSAVRIWHFAFRILYYTP
jgi:hypothetical protein